MPTHYIKADVDKNILLVRHAETFGDGLELYAELKAAGSFIRRYGKYVEENQPLDYLVEITLKDDQRGDPLINEESLCQIGLMTPEEVKQSVELTKESHETGSGRVRTCWAGIDRYQV